MQYAIANVYKIIKQAIQHSRKKIQNKRTSLTSLFMLGLILAKDTTYSYTSFRNGSLSPPTMLVGRCCEIFNAV